MCTLYILNFEETGIANPPPTKVLARPDISYSLSYESLTSNQLSRGNGG